MFESLSSKLTAVFDRIRGKGFLNEEDIDKALREIRIVLLEADVALPVVKDFCEQIKQKAIGQEVIKSVSPAQMVVKIVHDQLVDLLKADDKESQINLAVTKPAVLLMVGLQGSGKTTTSAKIAGLLKKTYHKNVMLASLDIYRPAAREQLKIVGDQLSVETLPIIENETVEQITKRALHEARIKNFDLLILDTAGRLHIDEELMDEVARVKNMSTPAETLLVVDSMIGQDAVNIAKSFEEKIGITGVVLTRLDGDGRGGAALSMRAITNRPIKFIGFGEKLDAIDVFDAERVAGRILDMGDIVALVQKAATNIEQDEMEKMAKKMESGRFDMNDLAKQLEQMQKMGGMSSMMSFLPGMGQLKDKISKAGINDKMLDHQLAIIRSMTKKEKKDPSILNASRKRRIASGSGRTPQEINKLLKQYEQMKDVMKKMKKMGLKGLMQSGLGQLFGKR
ncbi:MAG: Signal recognition particle protein [Holosporales bacterium]